MSHPRVEAAFADACLGLGAALKSRSLRIPDADLRKAASSAAVTLAALRLRDPEAEAKAVAAFGLVCEALRRSEAHEAQNLLVDAGSSCSIARLAAAPDVPPAFAQGAVALPAPEPTVPAYRALSRQAAQRMAGSVRLALSITAACAYARTVMALDFQTRDEADAARARVMALIDPLLDNPAITQGAFNLLADLQGTASRHLAETALSLKRIVRVVTPKPLPACLLAWQLYQDTTQAGELVRRNRVATPCFMPTVIEAVAP